MCLFTFGLLVTAKILNLPGFCRKQFRKLSGTVSKHVAVVSELSRIVQGCHLMGVSETLKKPKQPVQQAVFHFFFLFLKVDK